MLRYPLDRSAGYVVFSNGQVPLFPKAGHTKGKWKRKVKKLRDRLKRYRNE